MYIKGAVRIDRIDIAVVGAGASGMTAAIAAAAQKQKDCRRARIVLFEKEADPGKKLLATGNGRCNLGNRTVNSGFYEGDKAFIDAVFASFPPERALSFFESIGVPHTDDGSGRLYPVSRRAGAVTAALRAECARLGVELRTKTPVATIERSPKGFLINGECLSRALIVTAGGDAGLRKNERSGGFALLAALGIRSSERYPCLCGLKLGDYPAALKGVRNISGATLTSDGKALFSECGEVQFNADGVSGIPVMQASLTASRILNRDGKCALTLDLLPDMEEKEIAEAFASLAGRFGEDPAQQLFGGYLPKPLCVYLLKKAGLAPSAPFPVPAAERFAKKIKSLRFEIVGTADLRDAQVSGGGAYTDQFDPATLQARAVPGLFAAGETLDVTGRCGGYNLTWAWCSGHVAGRAAGKY